MKIRIIINNIGDGDAIFVVLQKEGETCFIVVDAGRQKDGKALIDPLKSLVSEYGKKAPDLFIGTHYDDDHIAGLLPLIDAFKEYPTELWMFDSSKLLKAVASINNSGAKKEFDMFPSEADIAAGSSFGAKEVEARDMLVTTLKKEQDILQFAKMHGYNIKEPIAGECSLANWPELQILGPTRKYYDKLFPPTLEGESIIRSMVIMEEETVASIQNPCTGFRKNKSPVTPVNLNSLIFAITACERKFLFAADAGIDSFYEIPGYNDAIKNVYWLKQPHHGSKNNFNHELLLLMNPQKIAVSGNGHISEELMACLRTVCKELKTTKESGTIEYEEGCV